MKYQIKLNQAFWGEPYRWCLNQFGQHKIRWDMIIDGNVIFLFEEEKDAMLFALRWGYK